MRIRYLYFCHELNGVHSELSEEERYSILSAPEFLDFVEQSSKVVQRVLNDDYDYIRDYRDSTDAGGSVCPNILLLHSSQPSSVMTLRGALSAYASSGTNVMVKIDQ